MGKFSEELTAAHKSFIADQQMFFVATAPLSRKGRVNVSPKGLDAFRVLSDREVGYMDLISSGNETSAHTLENERMTIMMCSFGPKPMIFRMYGKGRVILPDTPDWEVYAPHFQIYPSTRQLVILDIELIQTSCGFGVPIYDYVGERSIHFEWAETKGEDGLVEYIKEKNLVSLDGLPTDLGIKMNT